MNQSKSFYTHVSSDLDKFSNEAADIEQTEEACFDTEEDNEAHQQQHKEISQSKAEEDRVAYQQWHKDISQNRLDAIYSDNQFELEHSLI